MITCSINSDLLTTDIVSHKLLWSEMFLEYEAVMVDDQNNNHINLS